MARWAKGSYARSARAGPRQRARAAESLTARSSAGALAHLPVRVLATTGGRATEGLMDALPDNARVRAFISFEHWLPQAALLITNGGYGSINYALDSGVPLIVAGTGEDKLEAAARVVAAGCGISLHTSTPSAEQILAAATRILQQPIYRRRAALVHHVAGTTRDRKEGEARLFDLRFRVASRIGERRRTRHEQAA